MRNLIRLITDDYGWYLQVVTPNGYKYQHYCSVPQLVRGNALFAEHVLRYRAALRLDPETNDLLYPEVEWLKPEFHSHYLYRSYDLDDLLTLETTVQPVDTSVQRWATIVDLARELQKQADGFRG